MRFVKLAVVLFVWFIAAIALTWGWIQRIGAKTGGNAVDITYLAQSPLYLLTMVVIVLLAGFIYWRWTF